MIIGIGVDIAETSRIERLVSEYGKRFAGRILTAPELEEFERRQQSSAYLATRFAAKEAVAKALGTGIGKQFGFHSVQIEHDALGKPELKFLGEAKDWIAGRNIDNAMVSISDEKHYAVAMVVLEATKS
ncbi:MAG: holo-ACP synthase [Pseudomonadota bacterium]